MLLQRTVVAVNIVKLKTLVCIVYTSIHYNKSALEIMLVRLSETSNYLLGQVKNTLAVIHWISENLQPYFICRIYVGKMP